MYDVIIIGAGISGSLISHSLSKYNLNICVVESFNDVAEGATGANSAIIHSGHDPKEGTLKAHYNLLGNRMYKDLCHELKVDYKEIGAFVVATSPEEEKSLDILIENCIRRNIPYEILDKEELLKREKNLSDNVTKGISLPTTGIITPWQVCIASMEESILNGVTLKLNYHVCDIRRNDNSFIISNGKEEIEGKYLINCAGCFADEINKMLGIERYYIKPRKGQYYILDHTGEKFVEHIIYPVPSEKGKGVLAVPTIHHNTLLGPNSEFVEDKEDLSTDEGLDYVSKELNKTLKNIPTNKIIHTYAGNRPTGNTHDFVIGEDEEIKNFIHVGAFESPGLTSAPAVAKDICELIVGREKANKKENYLRRKEEIILNRLSDEEKDKLIKENPDYGKMICRCEKISLGEIKDVIHRKCGARTVRGVKRRCRPGMGRCQGGFCEVEVVKILSKELNIPINEIMQKDDKTKILVEEAKEVF